MPTTLADLQRDQWRKDCQKHPDWFNKCPKCGNVTVVPVQEQTDMGDFSWSECVSPGCDYKADFESDQPGWMKEESRPASGPGSRAPHGMGIRDEYGGL